MTSQLGGLGLTLHDARALLGINTFSPVTWQAAAATHPHRHRATPARRFFGAQTFVVRWHLHDLLQPTEETEASWEGVCNEPSALTGCKTQRLRIIINRRCKETNVLHSQHQL